MVDSICWTFCKIPTRMDFGQWIITIYLAHDTANLNAYCGHRTFDCGMCKNIKYSV